MRITWIIAPFALAAAAVAIAATPSKEEIAGKLNGVSAEDLTESSIAGLYQVTVGSTVAYVTADGRYFIDGDVIDLESLENITESARAEARLAMLDGVDSDDMIVFRPANGEVKHAVTIFTDIDCGYCRQFHRDIERVNGLGIEVRYLFYPRTGPSTESWEKAVNVWCSANRNNALTRAKLGGSVPDAECGDTPIDDHFELGHRVGVRGTPAIFAENGELLGGYLPPDQLATALEKSAN